MYYSVLCVTNLLAVATMATMYMINFVNKLQKGEEKGHSISHVYNIDHRMTDLVCMYRSATPLFKTPTVRWFCA